MKPPSPTAPLRDLESLPRLPLGAVRDLLASTRALYRALLAANPNDGRLHLSA